MTTTTPEIRFDSEQIASRLPRLARLDLAGRSERWMARLAFRLGFRGCIGFTVLESAGRSIRVLRSSDPTLAQQLRDDLAEFTPRVEGAWLALSRRETRGPWARLLARTGHEFGLLLCLREDPGIWQFLLLTHEFALEARECATLCSAARLLLQQAESQRRVHTLRAESTALRRELRVQLERQLSLESQNLRWRKLFAHADRLAGHGGEIMEMLVETASAIGDALGLSCLLFLRRDTREVWLLGSPELCRSTRGAILHEIFDREHLGALEEYDCVREESSLQLRGLLAVGAQEMRALRARHEDGLLLGVRLGGAKPAMEELEFFERAGQQMLTHLHARARELAFEQQLVGLQGTVDELLDRQAASHALAERQLSEQLLASLPTAVMLLSSEGALRYANPAARTLFALSPAEAAGSEELGETTAAALRSLVAELHEAGEFSREIRWSGDSVQHLRVELRELKDSNGDELGVLLSLRDITQRKRLELEHAEFVGSVSHELRTPLTSMRAALELVLQGEAGPVSEEQSHFLEMSRRNIDRLARLIERLLDVARHDDGRLVLQREERCLAEIFEPCLSVFHSRAAREARQLRWQIDPALRAFVDPDRFVEIVENLVGNALKFTEPGGNIELRLEAGRPSLDAEARSLARAAGRTLEGCELLIKDDGRGMNQGESTRAFERFYQAGDPLTGRPQGVGLGLAITRALVAAHDGQINLESSPGEGTIVRVWIPSTEADARICATVDQITHGLREWSRSLTCGRLVALRLPPDLDAASWLGLREALAELWGARDLPGNWPSEAVGDLCFALAAEEDWRPAFANDARRLGARIGVASYPAQGRAIGTLLARALEAAGDSPPARVEQES
ncbi:MAG TPA: ATP-binding protein [Candidatus Krumholzibacteria bacterium]|jgi:PAS domain S-box-containing protein